MMKINSVIVSSAIITLIYLLTWMFVHLLFPLLPFSESMVRVLVADIAATVVVFIFSVIFNNSSVYDPYWSVLPPVVVIYLMTLFPHGDHIRQFVILGLTLFWSIRLTANWFRGWKGLGHQDWRYTSIAEKTGRWYWPVSFLGIHVMPTIFVFLGCLPLWYSLPSREPFGVYDIAATLFTLMAILTEWMADEQLFRFKKSNSGNSFISTGIWGYSRHPNYLGEICFWGGLFLFVISSNSLSSFTGYWTVIGWVSMIILFKFISIPLMEKRNITRKPGYVGYINQVPSLLPRFSKGTK
jgi:steroid 5-alpha reductase family enzyme